MKNSDYDTELELQDYEYEDLYEEKRKRRKKIGLIILIILVILLLLFTLKSCFFERDIVEVSENEKTLLEAGKEYFKENYDEMPTAPGSCKDVSLEKLLLEGYLKKKNFQNCHGEDTKVKVCVLESKKEHWTPFLTCDEVSTEFSDWQEGKESDLVENQSDVRFKFLGKVLDTDDASLADAEEYWQDEVPYDAYKTNTITTYYKHRDKYYVWNINEKRYYPNNAKTASGVKEYYTSSPASGYTYKDSPSSSAAKYYKNGEKIYWENGKYKMTSPGDGYIYKDSGVNVTAYRTRTFTANTSGVKATLMYVCASEGTSVLKNSTKPCSTQTDGFTIQKETYYTCGSNKVSKDTICKCNVGELNKNKNACGTYSNWSSYTSKSCGSESDTCDVIVRSTYKWFKYKKEYYGSALYTAAPASGLYRDSATATTAYKWYKLVKVGEQKTLANVAPSSLATFKQTEWGEWTTYSVTKPATSKNTEVQTRKKVNIQKVEGKTKDKWEDLSKDYVTEKELIKLFNEKKLDVDSLEDIISKNGEAKYEIQMYYRNRI